MGAGGDAIRVSPAHTGVVRGVSSVHRGVCIVYSCACKVHCVSVGVGILQWHCRTQFEVNSVYGCVLNGCVGYMDLYGVCYI